VIAVDSSSLVHYLAGDRGADVELVDQAAASRQLVIPPLVLTEVLSAPAHGRQAGEVLAALPVLDVTPGYWERAGLLRARVLAKGFKARLGDALIAQSCLDHGVSLITRDRDFRHFVAHGLRIAP
jgi:predicted nucleic acid-binding protein